MKFAEQFLSNGMADPQHTPTFRSSLLRVPGSINSKCIDKSQKDTSSLLDLTERHKQVRIIQKWNGYRPAINYLLNDFRKYLIQKDIDQYHKQQKLIKKYKQKALPSDNNNNNANSINWIESYILQGTGSTDYRKVTTDLVLAKYLVNVKKYSYDTANNTIVEWLDKCSKKRPLDFNVNYKVNHALRQAIDGPVPLPMLQYTIKEKYPDMYKEIFFSV